VKIVLAVFGKQCVGVCPSVMCMRARRGRVGLKERESARDLIGRIKKTPKKNEHNNIKSRPFGYLKLLVTFTFSTQSPSLRAGLVVGSWEALHIASFGS